MIAEAFLVCALALPPANFTAPGGHHDPLTYQTFIKEYKWIHDLLEKSFPKNEFLIIHRKIDKTPRGNGWIEIPLKWRRHNIYRRPIKGSQTHKRTISQDRLFLAA
jgi:hypothetical protein